MFLIGASIASTLSALLGTKAAKGQTIPRPDGFTLLVGPANLLERNGRVLTDRILIVRNTADTSNDPNGQIIGVSPHCPHRGCVVDWKQDTQEFVCPCHASVFDASGRLVRGVATQSLQAFDVKIENNAFLIKPKSV